MSNDHSTTKSAGMWKHKAKDRAEQNRYLRKQLARIRNERERAKQALKEANKPTVSLDVISLVASSCGYYRGDIEHHAAQECTVHVATQRGRAKRPQRRHPPRDQSVAPRRERHCSRRRLPPRCGTAQAPSRELGHPGAHTGEDTTPAPHHATGGAAHPSLFFSPPGHGFSTLDARCNPLI